MKAYLLPLLLLCLAPLTLTACEQDPDEPTADVTTDPNPTDLEEIPDIIQPTHQDRTYRFTTLEVLEPDVSTRVLLSAVIDANMKTPPNDPLAINILLQFKDWQIDGEQVSLLIGGGSGYPDMEADPIAFTFDPTAEPAFVPAVLESDSDGSAQRFRNEVPTNLFFPVAITDATFIVPFRDIRFEVCYGATAKCDGTTEDKIFGFLMGGIIEEEANEVTVEFQPGDTMSFGDLLRDATPQKTCTQSSECEAPKQCNPQNQCVFLPDRVIDGKPAFSLRARFRGQEIPYFVP